MKLVLALLVAGSAVLAQVQGNIWDQLDRCEYLCSARCSKLATDLRAKLDNVESNCTSNQPVDQTLYKEVYAFATSSSGMWMNPDPARAFTDSIVSQPNAKVRFAVFKDAYAYAKSSSGLWLNPDPAREFAMRIFNLRNAQAALTCYKEAYTYAKSSSGLWLNPVPARAHAEKVCKI